MPSKERRSMAAEDLPNGETSNPARRGRRWTALPCWLPPFWLTWTSRDEMSLFSCAAEATESGRVLPVDVIPSGAGLAALQARIGRRAAGERRLTRPKGAAAAAIAHVMASEKLKGRKELGDFWNLEADVLRRTVHCAVIMCLACFCLSGWNDRCARPFIQRSGAHATATVEGWRTALKLRDDVGRIWLGECSLLRDDAAGVLQACRFFWNIPVHCFQGVAGPRPSFKSGFARSETAFSMQDRGLATNPAFDHVKCLSARED